MCILIRLFLAALAVFGAVACRSKSFVKSFVCPISLQPCHKTPSPRQRHVCCASFGPGSSCYTSHNPPPTIRCSCMRMPHLTSREQLGLRRWSNIIVLCLCLRCWMDRDCETSIRVSVLKPGMKPGISRFIFDVCQ